MQTLTFTDEQVDLLYDLLTDEQADLKRLINIYEGTLGWGVQERKELKLASSMIAILQKKEARNER